MFRVISIYLLLCIAGQYTSSIRDRFIAEFQRRYIIPDLFNRPDEQLPEDMEILKVTYPDDWIVDMGNQINQTEANYTPIVDWNADNNKLYTLFFLNLDAPTQRQPTMRPFVHWWVANIRGTNISSGKTLYEYMPPYTPDDSGWHRYLFLVYRQPGKVYYMEEEYNAWIGIRGPIQIIGITGKYRLEGPVAVNYFMSLY